MILAHLAGIKVFATGGLGGVHQGGQDSFDISADLTELGRTPVAVISAGCKSFLDLPRTLEYLETQGVGIATFADGREGPVDLPAFYVRDSGIQSPRIVKDEKEAAAIIFAQSRLPIQSGLWFAGPVPAQDSLSKEEVDAWVRGFMEQQIRPTSWTRSSNSAVEDLWPRTRLESLRMSSEAPKSHWNW
jgi:pseudouridylate synthase / pseudouridine kinase